MFEGLKSASIILIFSSIIPDKIEKWEFVSSLPPPANLTQKITASKPRGNWTVPEIEVWLKDIREDFDFALFADPFVKNESDCPTHLREHKNLRQFFDTCSVRKGDNESVSRFFGNIFTGCYYFVMTNKEGTNWQHGPIFYTTSYRYLDTKLELSEHHSFKPAEINSTMALRFVLKVPLSCIQVKVELFQHKGEIKDALDEIKNGEARESQKCFIQKIGKEVKPNCQTSPLFTNLTLVVHAEERDDGWTGRMVWEHLQLGGGKYYLHLVGNPTLNCSDIYGAENINTWMPIDGEIWKNFGLANSTNTPSQNLALNNSFWFLIKYAVVGGLVLAIICYWAWKYHKIAWGYLIGIQKKFDKDLTPELEPMPDYKESGQILLLYEKGSPKFMEEMCVFRDHLTKHCNNYSVHDVYATKEWNRVSELGAAGWIHELLKDGSKVVWVDSPQFRSRFNNKEQRHTAQDFRDNAIRYAICVATDSFQNAITQYCRHFVVRVKGYEVQNGEDDPLKMVSPHARYNIPEQLSVLCQHLRGSTEHSENNNINREEERAVTDV